MKRDFICVRKPFTFPCTKLPQHGRILAANGDYGVLDHEDGHRDCAVKLLVALLLHGGDVDQDHGIALVSVDTGTLVRVQRRPQDVHIQLVARGYSVQLRFRGSDHGYPAAVLRLVKLFELVLLGQIAVDHKQPAFRGAVPPGHGATEFLF
jgi:hypothetical protein